jgi:hypothetical protein
VSFSRKNSDLPGRAYKIQVSEIVMAASKFQHASSLIEEKLNNTSLVYVHVFHCKIK